MTEEDDNIDDIIKVINTKCKPFVSQYKGHIMGLFYRAVKKKALRYMIKTARLEDRKPLHSTVGFHFRFNELLIEKFGWPVRNGVFATSDWSDTRLYGNPHIFFPIGKFDFVWSPKIADLFQEVENTPDEEEEIKNALDSYIENKDLDKAWFSGHELSFKCDEYLLIDDLYQQQILNWWKGR